jgi:hypothetical protein
MSQDIIELRGRMEIPNSQDRTVTYKESTMQVTSFSGGKQGPMLQFNTGSYPDLGYTQLTREQVIELVHTLIGWL